MLIFFIVGIIDKHYVGLCQSLQGDVDHLLATLLQLQALSDKEMETVYSSDNKIQAIIDGLITNCALKNDLLLFCGVFECLFGYKGKIDVIEMLRDGKGSSCCLLLEVYTKTAKL